MKCDGVRGLLSAYVDGELSPGELLHVEQHLRRCHTCADEVDSLRQTIALVSSLEEVELPADFHARLHERLVAAGAPVANIRRMPAAPAWQRNVRRWALPAAAAAAALAIGVSGLSDLWKDGAPGKLGPVVTVKPMGQTTEATPPAPPEKPPTTIAEPKTAVTNGSGTEEKKAAEGQQGSGAQSGKSDSGTTIDPGTPVLPPKPTGSGTGTAVATEVKTNPTTPPIEPKWQYGKKMVATVADKAKTVERLTQLVSVVSGSGDSLTFTVPLASLEKTLSDFKAVLPDAVVTDANKDLALAIKAAEDELNKIRREINSYSQGGQTPENQQLIEEMRKTEQTALNNLNLQRALLEKAEITVQLTQKAQ